MKRCCLTSLQLHNLVPNGSRTADTFSYIQFKSQDLGGCGSGGTATVHWLDGGLIPGPLKVKVSMSKILNQKLLTLGFPLVYECVWMVVAVDERSLHSHFSLDLASCIAYLSWLQFVYPRSSFPFWLLDTEFLYLLVWRLFSCRSRTYMLMCSRPQFLLCLTVTFWPWHERDQATSTLRLVMLCLGLKGMHESPTVWGPLCFLINPCHCCQIMGSWVNISVLENTRHNCLLIIRILCSCICFF